MKTQINKLQKDIRKKILEEENNNFSKKIRTINDNLNPRNSWNEIKDIFNEGRKKRDINKIKDENGNIHNNHKDIANKFSERLDNIFQPNKINNIRQKNGINNWFKNHPFNHHDQLTFITPDDILRKINKLKNSKSPGDDGITNKTLKLLL